jgi:hypothetical protein
MSVKVFTGVQAGMMLSPDGSEHIGLIYRFADPAHPDYQYAVTIKGDVAVIRVAKIDGPPIFLAAEILREVTEDNVCKLSSYLEGILDLPPGNVNADNVSQALRSLSLGYVQGLITGVQLCSDRGAGVMLGLLKSAIAEVVGG